MGCIIKRMATTQDLLDFAEAVARDAGTVMLDYFARTNKGVTTKTDKSLVTEADKGINTMLIDRVKAAYPAHGVYGEEESYEGARRELWVCDPIDGTDAFIMGAPTAMFSLAFVVDGKPEIGVLYDPFMDRLFTAMVGGGAYMNGQKIHVSDQSTVSGARLNMAGGLDMLFAREDLLKQLMANGALMRVVPGNVFKSSLIAQGRTDGYIFPGKSAHDIAAAKVIVEEAGGKVTDLAGKPQTYAGKITGAIVSNGSPLHDALVEAIAAFGVENVLGY